MSIISVIMSIIVLGFAAWTRHFASAYSHQIYGCPLSMFIVDLE